MGILKRERMGTSVRIVVKKRRSGEPHVNEAEGFPDAQTPLLHGSSQPEATSSPAILLVFLR